MKTVVLLMLGMMIGFVLAGVPLYAGDPASSGRSSYDIEESYADGCFDGQRAAERQRESVWSNSPYDRNPC